MEVFEMILYIIGMYVKHPEYSGMYSGIILTLVAICNLLTTIHALYLGLL